MQQIDKGGMAAIKPLFAGMDDTMILSCLQGHMGCAWADDAQRPKAAQIVTGDLCFLAGDSECEGAQQLASHIPQGYASPSLHVFCQSGGWRKLVEDIFGARAVKYTRYALCRDASGFDAEKLADIAHRILPEYRVVPIDARLFDQTRREAWSKDFCSQFKDYADYQRRGLGFAAMAGEEPVSGASSYTVYDGGIEVEIATKTEHRRKGLAAACAARLMLACMERGLFPNWDAANQKSLALACKLGYRFDREYIAYELHI